MKFKSLALTLLLMTLLTACSPYQVDTDLTDEKRQEYIDQIEQWKTVLENEEATDTEKLEAYMEMGVAYERLGNYKNALEYYEETLKIDTANFVALNNSAHIYEEVGEYDMASRFILVLYLNNPSNQEVVSDAVRIYCETGEPEKSLTILEEYATNYQSDETSQFISDTYVSIGQCDSKLEGMPSPATGEN